MKKRCFLVAIVIVFTSIGTGMYFNGWANELVKGWYDPVNDWFVFEWERPDAGKITSILDPSNKIDPVIKAEATYDKNTSEYVFDYQVTNKGGRQPIFTILIKFTGTRAEIYDASVPTEDWRTDENKMENAWDWAKTGGEINGIPPGENVQGFSFKSKGIPVITNAMFYGHSRIEKLFYGQEGIELGPPGDSDTEEVADAFEIVYGNIKKEHPDQFKDVVRKTIGPTAPPAELKPVAFLDHIISMKHEAAALGWITNRGVERSLDAKLDAALKNLQSGNTKTAGNILGAFINEVEAQGCPSYDDCPDGKHLKPEAYALLKFNAQYLIDNLR